MSPFETLLVQGATWLAAAAAGWLVLLLLAAVVEAGSRGRVGGLAAVGCPTAWRPLLLALVAAVLALPATSASATWLPVPARTVDLAPREQPREHGPASEQVQAPQHARPSRQPASPDHVTVRPGDTLWALALALLPRGATDAEVADEVRRLHRLNRAALGPDPDLIHPGQRLALPGTAEGDRP